MLENRIPRTRVALKLLSVVSLLVLAWLLLSSIPPRVFPRPQQVAEPFSTALVLGHFLCFTAVTFLALWSRWSLPRPAILLLLVLGGVATEFLQMAVPGRHPDVFDGLQNLVGIALGASVWWAVATLRTTALRDPKTIVS